ncbi:MAG: NAD-dependent epimerase/dehydratase family protein [Mangrovibacterium sp.]
MELHTILSANGTITKELVPVLLEHNEKVRLVSRNPRKTEGVEIRKADVLNYEQLSAALKGSSIVYLVIGIQYDHQIWQRDWPVIMQNVIKCCLENGAKLIFFNDVYMYGRVEGVMTGETPYRPSSKKGQVRADVARMLQKEMEQNNMEAIIARAIDFYGPGVSDKSAPRVFVFQNMLKGKKAQWPINPNVPRSFNYTPDAAEAMYILARHPDAFGQIWHLPCVQSALTGKEFIRLGSFA